jgi:hypothetical protein
MSKLSKRQLDIVTDLYRQRRRQGNRNADLTAVVITELLHEFAAEDQLRKQQVFEAEMRIAMSMQATPFPTQTAVPSPPPGIRTPAPATPIDALPLWVTDAAS